MIGGGNLSQQQSINYIAKADKILQRTVSQSNKEFATLYNTEQQQQKTQNNGFQSARERNQQQSLQQQQVFAIPLAQQYQSLNFQSNFNAGGAKSHREFQNYESARGNGMNVANGGAFTEIRFPLDEQNLNNVSRNNINSMSLKAKRNQQHQQQQISSTIGSSRGSYTQKQVQQIQQISSTIQNGSSSINRNNQKNYNNMHTLQYSNSQDARMLEENNNNNTNVNNLQKNAFHSKSGSIINNSNNIQNRQQQQQQQQQPLFLGKLSVKNDKPVQLKRGFVSARSNNEQQNQFELQNLKSMRNGQQTQLSSYASSGLNNNEAINQNYQFKQFERPQTAHTSRKRNQAYPQNSSQGKDMQIKRLVNNNEQISPKILIQKSKEEDAIGRGGEAEGLVQVQIDPREINFLKQLNQQHASKSRAQANSSMVPLSQQQQFHQKHVLKTTINNEEKLEQYVEGDLNKRSEQQNQKNFIINPNFKGMGGKSSSLKRLQNHIETKQQQQQQQKQQLLVNQNVLKMQKRQINQIQGVLQQSNNQSSERGSGFIYSSENVTQQPSQSQLQQQLQQQQQQQTSSRNVLGSYFINAELLQKQSFADINSQITYMGETPLKNYQSNIQMLTKKHFKEDYSSLQQSMSAMSSGQKSGTNDISSTGGSKSQFLSKLRFKKGIGGVNNNENDNSSSKRLNTEILLYNQQINQSEQEKMASYINFPREGGASRISLNNEVLNYIGGGGDMTGTYNSNDQQNNQFIQKSNNSSSSNYFGKEQQQKSNLFTQEKQRQSINAIRMRYENHSKSNNKQQQQSIYSSNGSTSQNFNNEQKQIPQDYVVKDTSFKAKGFKAQNKTKQSNPSPNNNGSALYIQSIGGQSSNQEKTSSEGGGGIQQVAKKGQEDKTNNYMNKNQNNNNVRQIKVVQQLKGIGSVLPSHEEMLELIQLQQKQILDQELLLLEYQKKNNGGNTESAVDDEDDAAAQYQMQNTRTMRTNIPSIDLSNIAGAGIGGNNRRGDLSESYVTKVGETTNEDFKEILHIIDSTEKKNKY